jgi:hypothetical protein
MSNPSKIVGSDFSAAMHFSVIFNQIPNFTNVDSNGRQQDSFQIYMAFNPATPNPANTQSVDVLVRGDEIHLAHAIRIRDARPAVSDPHSGGWGAIRGSVPFRVAPQPNGTAVMSFSVPFEMLGIKGQFAWVLETYNFGSQVDKRQGVSP